MLHKIRHLFAMDTLLPLGAVIVGVSLVWSTIGVMQRNFQFQRQVDELRQRITLMEIENKTVQYRIAYFKTSEYAELAARQNLNKSGPGEKLLVVPPSNFEHDDTSSLAPQAAAPLPASSNFQQWLFFLFGQRRENKE